MKKQVKITTLAIVLIITIILMSVCLVACMNPKEDSQGFSIQGTTLICIGTSSTFNSRYELYYDKDTKVMYMFVKFGYGAGLTPMYNADGTLKLYEEQ